MNGVVTSYEVLRPFRGFDRELQPGEILDARDLRPANAQALVDLRKLRPLSASQGTLEQERARWRGQLQPYAIGSPSEAPAGSALARLVAEANETAERADALETRAAALNDQLGKAQAVIDQADEGANFPKIAAALAEIHIVGALAHDAEREAGKARAGGRRAAEARDQGWQRLGGAIATLHALIDGDMVDAKASSRWRAAWQYVRELLDVRREGETA